MIGSEIAAVLWPFIKAAAAVLVLWGVWKILGFIVAGLWWLDDANEDHEQTPQIIDDIVSLKRSDAQYQTYWGEAIKKRAAEIEEAEDFYKAYKGHEED